MISSAPILKHLTFFLQELTYIQRIQPVPDDLSLLAHTVSIYYQICEAMIVNGLVGKRVIGDGVLQLCITCSLTPHYYHG